MERFSNLMEKESNCFVICTHKALKKGNKQELRFSGQFFDQKPPENNG
jgi:hypothetical protein